MTLVDNLLHQYEVWLVAALVAGSFIQSRLGAKADYLERFRRKQFPKLNPIATLAGRPLLREKGTEDYICTIEMESESFERVLDAKYSRNAFATLKYRTLENGRQYEAGSWVHKQNPIAPKQHHVYYFDNDDGTIDVYGHKEANITNPDGHLSGKQTHGDPDGVLRDALEAANIPYDLEEALQ